MVSQPRKYLFFGGSGSGKSELAQRLAARCGEQVIYLATGAAEGPEMEWRIQQHQQSRPSSWITVEAQRALGEALAACDAPDGGSVLLEDVGSLVGSCLPWVAEHEGELSNPDTAMETAQHDLAQEIDSVFDWCAAHRRSLIVVSSEVGLGFLPPSPVSRLYKDVIGKANQALAERVDGVYLVVAGLALDLKASHAGVLESLSL